jgi:hypothetical protein
MKGRGINFNGAKEYQSCWKIKLSKQPRNSNILWSRNFRTCEIEVNAYCVSLELRTHGSALIRDMAFSSGTCIRILRD